MSSTASPAESVAPSRTRIVVTICTGSFLLFLVQPMVARMALPRVGGAPSVWNSAMLVYQALLLAGYAYAHLLGRARPRVQGIVHTALFVLAALTLPIALSNGDPPAGADPVLWVPWLLIVSIGPLFFIVAAQAPLMQRWFLLSGGQDPYPLYAASNLGSFGGLIAYPLLVEPFMPVAEQSWLWSGGYLLLLSLVAWYAWSLPRGDSGFVSSKPTSRLKARQVGKWIILAAIPSGLMLSTSLHMTTDIVAMPLLWVLPLGIYLLSFSVAFAAQRSLANAITTILPLVLLIGATPTFAGITGFPVVLAVLALLTLFVVAVGLHAHMYDSRPAPEQLTAFYLAMSAGGVLGGIFCALVAPVVFDWTYEHPLLLIAAALCAQRKPLFAWAAEAWTGRHRHSITALLLIIGLLLSTVAEGVIFPALKSDAIKAGVIVLLFAMALAAIGNRLLFAGLLAYLMLCLGGWNKLALSASDGALTRSYFGVYQVRNNGPDVRVLVHGTTLHGMQNLKPGTETQPTSYYAPSSGVGLAMRAAPRLYGPHARIGVVGLGTGTLGCYRQPGQSWRFYEIDPAMIHIARDSGAFSFLARCQPHPDIVLGDARIMLAREGDAKFDLLAIDAFSSDSVPMHLLTREAFATYAQRLAPKGLLLVHISNRYLDLEPVIAAAAKQGGWDARMRYYRPALKDISRHYSASLWIAMSRDKKALARLTDMSGEDLWQDPTARAGFLPWTDDYGSILPIMKLWK